MFDYDTSALWLGNQNVSGEDTSAALPVSPSSAIPEVFATSTSSSTGMGGTWWPFDNQGGGPTEGSWAEISDTGIVTGAGQGASYGSVSTQAPQVSYWPAIGNSLANMISAIQGNSYYGGAAQHTYSGAPGAATATSYPANNGSTVNLAGPINSILTPANQKALLRLAFWVGIFILFYRLVRKV